MTTEEQAVLDAAEAWLAALHSGGRGPSGVRRLMAAVEAMQAARTRPDKDPT